MREYELIYIVQPDASDERLSEIHERIDSAVTGGQGLILLRDDWGKRKLAYEINKFQKGHYFQLNFLGDGKFIAEMERLLRIDADVLRFITVLANESVTNIEARIEEAKAEAEEQARRRAEREALEAERERERAEAASLEAERDAAAAAAAEAARADSKDEPRDAEEPAEPASAEPTPDEPGPDKSGGDKPAPVEA